MASVPSISIFDFESFKSKLVCISFNACWIAFETSCMSSLLTISNVFSGITLVSTKDCGQAQKGAHNKLNGAGLFVKRKEAVEIGGGPKTHFFDGNSAQFAQLTGRFSDKRRFVPFAAMRHRSQKRTIRFNENPV